MQLDNSESNLKGIKWYNTTVQGNIMKGKQHILKVRNILYEWTKFYKDMYGGRLYNSWNFNKTKDYCTCTENLACITW